MGIIHKKDNKTVKIWCGFGDVNIWVQHEDEEGKTGYTYRLSPETLLDMLESTFGEEDEVPEDKQKIHNNNARGWLHQVAKNIDTHECKVGSYGQENEMGFVDLPGWDYRQLRPTGKVKYTIEVDYGDAHLVQEEHNAD